MHGFDVGVLDRHHDRVLDEPSDLGLAGLKYRVPAWLTDHCGCSTDGWFGACACVELAPTSW